MMRIASIHLLIIRLLLLLWEFGFAKADPVLSRKYFPSDFIFGAGTSAYQVEGAVAEDGRSPSIWDIATHSGPMLYEGNGDVAADQYHKFKEDVKLMADTSLDAYRMSISWSRLLPDGKEAISPKGLKYYNNLINELTDHGIEPHVTLYHYDHPQVLEDEYGGWLSPKMVEDFTAFADICFREFGDRVSYWTTINEPNVFAVGAYDYGMFAPLRCSEPFGLINCTTGNSTVEPYIVVHHTLLAHASVAALYREKYLAKQHGKIGLNAYVVWASPLTNSTADALAAQRAIDFYNGWIFDPIVFGDYPEIMKKNVGSRLPSFTEFQSKQIKGSFDFIGLNYYLTVYAQDSTNYPNSQGDFLMDMSVKLTSMYAFSFPYLGLLSPGFLLCILWCTTDQKFPLSWEKSVVFQLKRTRHHQARHFSDQFVPGVNLPSNPWGLEKVLDHIKQSYGNPPIFIQENGYGRLFNETLNDTARVDFIAAHINATLNAIRNGSNTRGYIIWSFLDVFEILPGPQRRYGLYHVDFEDCNRKRTPKYSARWFANFLKGDVTESKIEEVKLEEVSRAQV
ncbi:hypothetical protein H6P81_015132 [Aristolochia fimbriata]|uniref:Beta-glucosidase n=1 Tax=Aristolochia fimbriata TaxID=158543 RepID=A0AAV7E7P8_ARIFI|nr:hypothetical protein H6P81_015132 [Aristolochia fimbriata]